MDFSATIDLIIKDLEEARRIIDDLRNYPGVPAIQVELAKSKCKSAAEVIALLKDLRTEDTIQSIAEPKTETIEKQAAPLTLELSEDIIEIEPEQFPEAKTGMPAAPEITAGGPVVSSEAGILADRFGHPSGRVNEQLGILKSEDELTARVLPVNHLADAIGINDSFLFIKEIFNGDKNLYSTAISRLDDVTSIEDARAVLMSCTGKAAEGEAAKILLDLVKRKFQVHG